MAHFHIKFRIAEITIGAGEGRADEVRAAVEGYPAQTGLIYAQLGGDFDAIFDGESSFWELEVHQIGDDILGSIPV